VIHAKPSSFSFSRPNSYFNHLRKSLKYLHQSARNNIIRQQEQNKKYYDVNRLDPHYKVGDTVLIKLQGMKGKLDPLFSIQPKIVIGVRHPTYIVRDPITNIESRVHVGDIRPLLLD
jgi:ribosomal protein L21E